MGEPTRQVPLPLQVLAGTRLPPEQAAGRQIVPDANLAQPPCPLQSPLWPQVDASSCLQAPWGSLAFTATGLQAPSLPARLQATHAPLQARLQQTPSAQKPDSQSPWVAQVEPSGFLPEPHLPCTQATPPAQSLLAVHV